MAATIEEIRRRLKQAEQGKSGTNNFSGDNASYPFWNIAENSSATLRFLPDGNADNAFFWAERAVIRLPFVGVKGKNQSKPVLVQVPCMHMYGKSCPITEEIKPWWKDEGLVDTARKYYKKKSFIYQGFVVNSSLKEDSIPENPIRRFVLNAELHGKVKAALMDEELDSLPTDFINGLDFKVTKTKGAAKYVSYDTSNWMRKNRALSEMELASIEKFNLFKLDEFLPKEPDAEHLAIIMQMFEASIDGQLYDEEKFGNFYKPQGGRDSDDTVTTTKTSTVAAVAESEDEVEVETVTPVVANVAPIASVTNAEPAVKKATAQDLLADLKRRQSAKQ